MGAEILTVLDEISVRNMSVMNQNTVRNQELSICSKTVRNQSCKYTGNTGKWYEMYARRYFFLRPLDGQKPNSVTIDLDSQMFIYIRIRYLMSFPTDLPIIIESAHNCGKFDVRITFKLTSTLESDFQNTRNHRECIENTYLSEYPILRNGHDIREIASMRILLF